MAEHHEKKSEVGKAVKCLEAICQSTVSFLPIIEVKTRLRIATLLLKHSHNVNHAKSHLERSQLLLKSIPSCFELKCRAYSLLSQCYHLVGAVSAQKQILNKGLELTATSGDGFAGKLWSCNFNSQLANALTIEGDYQGSISALEQGYICATEMYYPELQMFFATSILQVHLMQWDDERLVEGAVNRCNTIWESIELDKRQQCSGLLFYHELLHIFYLLRIRDYKNATQHVDELETAMKADIQLMQHVQKLTKELDTINQDLSQSDLHYRNRSTLMARRGQLGEQLSSVIGPNSTSKDLLELHILVMLEEDGVISLSWLLLPLMENGCQKVPCILWLILWLSFLAAQRDFLRSVESGFNLDYKQSKAGCLINSWREAILETALNIEYVSHLSSLMHLSGDHKCA